MKTYPHIPQAKGQKFEGLGQVDVFDKLDGNNLRFEFSKKQGWHKFGSRKMMIDATHEHFGPAVIHFMSGLDQDILKCFKRTPDKLVVFAEWWGPNSFAGEHLPGEQLTLSVFDACVNNKGWLAPTDFRRTFEGEIPTPEWLGRFNWTRGFVHQVLVGNLDGITLEGVVGKTMKGNQLKMGKAKTKAWLDKLYLKYNKEMADQIANS